MQSNFINIKYDNPSDYTKLQEKTIELSDIILQLQIDNDNKDKIIADMQNKINVFNNLISQAKNLIPTNISN